MTQGPLAVTETGSMAQGVEHIGFSSLDCRNQGKSLRYTRRDSGSQGTSRSMCVTGRDPRGSEDMFFGLSKQHIADLLSRQVPTFDQHGARTQVQKASCR